MAAMGERTISVWSVLGKALSKSPKPRPAPTDAPAVAPQDAAASSFAALAAKLDYLDSRDIKRVREAYRFADEVHLGQFRASGEPYITHPIAVAGLPSRR